MISDAAFTSLRMAATLAMTVPSLHVTVAAAGGRDAGRLLVDVGWTGDGCNLPEGAVHVRPCQFRHSVAHAWARRREGHTVAFCGLPAGTDLRVDVGVAPGDRSLPGDIYRVRVEGGWRHLFASTLDSETCIEALGPAALVHRYGFQEDPATGVTIVHARTALADEHRIPELGNALLEARGRLLTAELLAEVGVTV